MRERFFETFDSLFIDNLNGDKYRTGKTTPDGRPDPSVFSTEHNREGIQVGTAIACLVRKQDHEPSNSVAYRELWGDSKRAQLAEQSLEPSRVEYVAVQPPLDFGLPFVTADYDADFTQWPRLDELMPEYFAGIMTSRDSFLVDTDRDAVVSRVTTYFDPQFDDASIGSKWPSVTRNSKRFGAHAVRAQLLARGPKLGKVVEYAYRPFDSRWLYWDPDTKLLDEKRADYVAAWSSAAMALVTTGRTRKGEIEPPMVVGHLVDRNFMDSGARIFPSVIAGAGLLSGDPVAHNISERARDYVHSLGCTPRDLFLHCVAVLSSAEYRVSNVGAVRHVGPALPLPSAPDLLLGSAALGERILQLQTGGDTESVEFASLGSLSSVDSAVLDPARDLGVTAHWGICGKGGICMPSTGRLVEREYSEEELASIAHHSERLGLACDQTLLLVGESCLDVYLNDIAYWRCVPANAWNHTIGGYQVIKKWLSYRERALLGRDLTQEEARYVTEMVRRIASLILMQPALDENYERVKEDVWKWPT